MQAIWGDEKKHEKNEPIESGVKIQDGMDIALCAIKGNKLYFAGANNPIWVLRGGELIELKGQKQPIGKFDNAVDFESKTFDLIKGDLIYLFSDGYADQFGGDKGKKMKYANLKKYIQEIALLPLKEQQQLLLYNFEKWRGDLEQVDDVCILGFKL
jgi:serine phosphatase RsbU (regulator of sigma subunit)